MQDAALFALVQVLLAFLGASALFALVRVLVASSVLPRECRTLNSGVCRALGLDTSHIYKPLRND